MARLEDIFPGLEGLSEEELRDQTRQIREDRKASKAAKRKSTKRARLNASEKLSVLLDKMTPEQRRQFMAEMEKK